LLARQHLIERRDASALDEIEHLAGMQAQVPNAPYVGLWSRLEKFEAKSLSDLIENHQAVRLGLMRNTIHLMSARDCLDFVVLFRPLLTQRFRASPFARALPDVDFDAVANEAKHILHAGPLTLAELGARLATGFAGPPESLAYVVRHLVPIVQVPPRGLWRRSAQPRWATVEDWLGAAPDEQPSADRLVLRYLEAFGPATVSDIASWSGLTGLKPVVERLRDRLVSFRDEKGRELFDLPEAPRPNPNMPVPVRLLPEYDNLLLGHQDRTRVIAFEHRHVILNGTFLLDGVVAGIWVLSNKKDQSRLTVSSFKPLASVDRTAIGEEAERLLGFAASGSKRTLEFTVAG
jgi:hypothetical protein